MKPLRVPAAASIFLLILLAGCRRVNLISRAPATAAAMANPLASDPAARKAGARLYEECARCHGDKRQGKGNAPALATSQIYNARPGALYWVLRTGAVFRGMPPYSALPGLQRWQIIVFLQQDRPGAASPAH